VTSADEEELVRAIARGGRAAFDELYQRTSPWLVVRLRRRCSDDELVAEVMQETYLAVWRAAGAFAGASVGGSAVGWLWIIAARRLVDAFRRRAHHASIPPAAALAETVPGAEDEVLHAEVGDELGAALPARLGRPGCPPGRPGCPGRRPATHGWRACLAPGTDRGVGLRDLSQGRTRGVQSLAAS
jgi:RNA polymerase sigma-70 factor (ECF subfamily)